MKYAALLRGINIGGKNKLPMTKLAELFAAAGCRDVETYIQSGNVVFEASAALAKDVPGAVSEAIEQQFGYRVPLILRSGTEMGNVVAGNPFLRQGAAEKELHVTSWRINRLRRHSIRSARRLMSSSYKGGKSTCGCQTAWAGRS